MPWLVEGEGLGRGAVRGMGEGPAVRAETAALQGCDDPARAQELRLRLLARACAVGADGVRLSLRHCAFVRRYLLHQLVQERFSAGGPERGRGRSPVP